MKTVAYGFVQLFAQAFLLNQDEGGQNETVNEAGVVNHDLIFKGDKSVWHLYPVDLLQQRQPKGLTAPLFRSF